ncbi:biofilm formation regulator BssR [Enterobacter sp. Colony194]|uniref:biofilm formation regulator BssR n=1 Tax=Enterobacter sp. Colony194 TaxID=2866201 RepID=UPI001C6999E2|nr:biofilm formation regulator BssR [Enterobacter sp. Colony194]
MSVARLKHDLYQKLIVARNALSAYLKLRKAKGYMSVAESNHLRDSLFDLCAFWREKHPRLKLALREDELAALHRGLDAISSAAVYLMTGSHDCPLYITVDADKLERAIATLNLSIRQLTHHQAPAEA